MVHETESSNRRLVVILGAGALLLALVVAIIIAVLVLGDGDSGEGVTATAANLMPDDTWLFLSMNPDFTAADNFDVVSRAWGDVPGFAEVVDNWPAVLFKDAEGLDYETDIASWLGSEVSFGMTGDIAAMMLQGAEMSLSGMPGEAPQLGEIPEIPQFIITAASQDTTASDSFLGKLRAEIEKDGTLLKETDYKGFQVVYSEPLPEADVSVAYATVDESIVLTVGGLETLQMAIDARDGDSLADSEAFAKTTAALPDGSAGFGYVNAGPLVDALLGSFEEMSDATGVSELAALQSLNPEQLRAFQGAGFSLSLDSQGIRFDAVVIYDKDSLPEIISSTASPNKAIEHAPADTLLYFSNVNLGGTLKSIVDLVLTQPDLALEDVGESLEMLESQLGFKLDDIYKALSGEFSLAVSYEAAGIMGDPSVPIGVLLQLENKTPDTFKQLMNLAGLVLLSSESDMVDTVEIGDVSVTLVNDPSGAPLVGWGLSDEFFAVGTSQALLETAFDGGDKLANDVTFTGVKTALPKENTGFFYLNVAKGIDILYQAMSSWEQEDFDRGARAILAPIKAIGAAGEPFSPDKDTMSAALFILLEGQ